MWCLDLHWIWIFLTGLHVGIRQTMVYSAPYSLKPEDWKPDISVGNKGTLLKSGRVFGDT